MIKDLSRKQDTDWNEKIPIELELSDLQIIFDSIGAMPPNYIAKKHKLTKFNRPYEYYMKKLTDMYEELYVIISEHNGVNDDDKLVDTEIELRIEEGDEE